MATWIKDPYQVYSYETSKVCLETYFDQCIMFALQFILWQNVGDKLDELWRISGSQAQAPTSIYASGFGDMVCCCFCIVTLCYITAYPLYSSYRLHVDYYAIDQIEFRARHRVLVEDVRMFCYLAIYMNALYMLRRLLIVASIMLWQERQFFALALQAYLSLLHLAFLFHVRPFATAFQNRVEKVNGLSLHLFVLLALTYQLSIPDVPYAATGAVAWS